MLSKCPKCGERSFVFKELAVCCENCDSIVDLRIDYEDNNNLVERYEKLIGVEKGSFVNILSDGAFLAQDN